MGVEHFSLLLLLFKDILTSRFKEKDDFSKADQLSSSLWAWLPISGHSQSPVTSSCLPQVSLRLEAIPDGLRQCYSVIYKSPLTPRRNNWASSIHRNLYVWQELTWERARVGERPTLSMPVLAATLQQDSLSAGEPEIASPQRPLHQPQVNHLYPGSSLLQTTAHINTNYNLYVC